MNWLHSVFYALLLALITQTQTLGAELNEQSLISQKKNDFINYMVKHYHYKRETLVAALSKAKYNEDVMYHITHPYEAKPWNAYRHYFITDKRIQGGVDYWKAHSEALQYAERHYSVPPSFIVSIIGVETNYGEHIGKYSALNVLTTLAFHYEHRARFFTRELAHLFLLVEEQQLPILLIRSSYAGAIGIPQFMPSTYHHYAVHCSRWRSVDFMNNNEAAIVSIANFLHTHGWQKNQPIACTFTSKGPLDPSLISSQASPRNTIKYLKNNGILPTVSLPDTTKVAIIQLKNEDGKENNWLVFLNFHVIMHYNPRIIYAMTVYQLSRAIQMQYDQRTS